MESRTEALSVSEFSRQFFSTVQNPGPFSNHYLCSTPHNYLPQAAENLFKTSGPVNVFLYDISDEMFSQYLHTDTQQLAKRDIGVLGLQKISFESVNLLFSSFLNKNGLTPFTFWIDELDKQSVSFIYSVCVYLSRRNVIKIICGESIEAGWKEKFADLRPPAIIDALVTSQFRSLIIQRNHDRHVFIDHVARREQTIEELQKYATEFSQQNGRVENENTRLKMEINEIEARAAETKKKLAADYEARLADQLKREIDLIDARADAAKKKLTEDYEANFRVKLKLEIDDFGMRADEFQGKLTAEYEAKLAAKQAEIDTLTKLMNDVNTSYPVLFTAQTIAAAYNPDPISAVMAYTEPKPAASRKRSLEEEKVNLSASFEPQAKQAKIREDKSAPNAEPSDEETISTLLAMKSSLRIRPKLRDKVEKELLETLTRRVIASNGHKNIVSFISNQLRIGEMVLAATTPFHELTVGNCTALIHYMAYIICNLPTNTEVFYDHGHERQLLLTTIVNMWRTIQALNLQYVNISLRLNGKNSEIIIANLSRLNEEANKQLAIINSRLIKTDVELLAANAKVVEAEAELLAANARVTEAAAEEKAAHPRLAEADKKIKSLQSQYAKIQAEEKNHHTELEISKKNINQLLLQLSQTQVDLSIAQDSSTGVREYALNNVNLRMELETLTKKYQTVANDLNHLVNTVVSIMHLLPDYVSSVLTNIVNTITDQNIAPTQAVFTHPQYHSPPQPFQLSANTSPSSSSMTQATYSPDSFFAPARASLSTSSSVTPSLQFQPSGYR